MPPPTTVQPPLVSPADPAKPGEPMSASVQPAGNAARTLATPEPKNKINEAIDYTLNHWTQLTRFLEDGRLPIDNNLCENTIRPVALGRKNWLFAGSPEGAKRMAIIYSLVATCKLNGINPYEYFLDILPKAASYSNKNIANLSPINWKMSKN